MLIPIRCFTCGKVLADKYLLYQEELSKLKTPDADSKSLKTKIKHEYDKNADIQSLVKKYYNEEIEEKYFYGNVPTGKILDNLGLTRYCCRRHLITNVDMMEII